MYTLTYKTVVSQNSDDFDTQVNKYLDSGYDLYGNPYTFTVETGAGSFSSYHYQAMILKSVAPQKQVRISTQSINDFITSSFTKETGEK